MKTLKTKTKVAKTSPTAKQAIAQRNSGLVAAVAKGEDPKVLAKRMKLSRQRVYQILQTAKSQDKAKKVVAKKTATKAAIVPASPVGRAQTLLLQVAVLKEAVRSALNSPRAKFTPKLGDEILGALASARTAEIAVKEASQRLEAVRRRLEGRVSGGRLSSASVGWKAVAQAARLSSATKTARA